MAGRCLSGFVSFSQATPGFSPSHSSLSLAISQARTAVQQSQSQICIGPLCNVTIGNRSERVKSGQGAVYRGHHVREVVQDVKPGLGDAVSLQLQIRRCPIANEQEPGNAMKSKSSTTTIPVPNYRTKRQSSFRTLMRLRKLPRYSPARTQTTARRTHVDLWCRGCTPVLADASHRKQKECGLQHLLTNACAR